MTRAVAWSAAAKWFEVFGSAATFLVMARLLGPEAWGLYGMTLLATILPETILGASLTDSLIQRRDLRPSHVAATYALLAGLALALLALCVLASPALAKAFGQDELLWLIPALSATLPALALGAPAAALLQRELRYRTIAVIDATGTLVAAAVGVAMGLGGMGVWSLVGMEAARRCVRAAAFMLAAPPALPLRFSLADLAELSRFNLASLGAKLLGEADLAIPRLAVGAFVGVQALGYFNLAMRIFQQGSSLLIAPFNAIALSVVSRVQNDQSSLHSEISRAMRLASLAAYPAFLGAAALAPAAIPFLLGAEWSPAIVSIQLLLLLGVRAATSSFTGGILRGCGRPVLQLLHVCAGVALIGVLAPLAAPFGLLAVVMAMLAKNMATWGIGAVLVEKATGYSSINQVTIGWRYLVASAAMASAVALSIPLLSPSMSGWLLLAALILIGAVVYAAGLAILDPASAGRVGRAAFARMGRVRLGRPRMSTASWRDEPHSLGDSSRN